MLRWLIVEDVHTSYTVCHRDDFLVVNYLNLRKLE
jgi:hypothetical protein